MSSLMFAPPIVPLLVDSVGTIITPFSNTPDGGVFWGAGCGYTPYDNPVFVPTPWGADLFELEGWPALSNIFARAVVSAPVGPVPMPCRTVVQLFDAGVQGSANLVYPIRSVTGDWLLTWAPPRGRSSVIIWNPATATGTRVELDTPQKLMAVWPTSNDEFAAILTDLTVVSHARVFRDGGVESRGVLLSGGAVRCVFASGPEHFWCIDSTNSLVELVDGGTRQVIDGGMASLWAVVRRPRPLLVYLRQAPDLEVGLYGVGWAAPQVLAQGPIWLLGVVGVGERPDGGLVVGRYPGPFGVATQTPPFVYGDYCPP